MKSVAFFRNSWKKKGKDRTTVKGKQDVSATGGRMPESAPCTPATTTFDILDSTLLRLSPDGRMRSQSEDAIGLQTPATFSRKASSPLSSGSSTSSLVEEITASPSAFLNDRYDFEYPPRTPVAWKASHGPPKNTSHGPPNLNLYSPVSGASPKSTGASPPVRPPRPPPLNLHPTTRKRPVNTGIPPRFTANRTITFMLPPNPRAAKSAELITTFCSSSRDPPGTSDDQEEEEYASKSSEETARCVCAAIPPDGNHVHPHRNALHDTHVAANLSQPPGHASLPTVRSPRTAHAILDLSDTPAAQRVYQNSLHTSSTPHLPPRNGEEVPPTPPVPFGSPNGPAHCVSDFPLSLFPPPPHSSLFIRRKITKNLVLRPSTSPNTPLLISPVLASSQHTQLASPTTPRPHTSPNHSKSYSSIPRYSSPRCVPPPLFDPPSTPLPTPPTSPEPPAARNVPSASLSKTLRSVRSINQLRSELLPPALPPTHRTTSSESVLEGTPSIKQTRRHIQSRPEVHHAARPFVSGSME